MLTVSKARLGAAIIPVAAYVLYVHWYYSRVTAAGEQAFLRLQAAHYETYYAKGGDWGLHLQTAVVTVVFLLVAYEVTAALLKKWLR